MGGRGGRKDFLGRALVSRITQKNGIGICRIRVNRVSKALPRQWIARAEQGGLPCLCGETAEEPSPGSNALLVFLELGCLQASRGARCSIWYLRTSISFCFVASSFERRSASHSRQQPLPNSSSSSPTPTAVFAFAVAGGADVDAVARLMCK